VETTRGEPILGPIRLLFGVGTVAGMSDGQLLDRFLDRRGDDEAAEVAFAALVERHGPMVLRACRAGLGDEHDAQDAFQATFLILARKAGAIRKHESAASWLHGVARRVASCSRKAAAVRRVKERKAAAGKADFVAEPDRSDLVPAVREEVGDLPEKYRTPLMLCLLDGLTHEEAATRLGWPVGTVKTRVRRAKDQLRARLTRRGLAPSLGAIGGALAAREGSAMPAALVRATARAALGFELGRNTALLSASVARLVELGIGSLIMTRLKIIGLVVTSIGVLAAGATTGLARQDSKTQEKPKPAEARPVEKAVDQVKPVSEDVAEEDLLVQLEMARIDLQLHSEKVEALKTELTTGVREADVLRTRLEGIKKARSLGDLQQYNVRINENEDLESLKKKLEKAYDTGIETQTEKLKQSRLAYPEMMRQVRRDEQRIKELEGRAARVDPAGSSSGPKAPGDDDRIEAAQLDIEFLEMEVAGLKQNVTVAMRVCLSAKDLMDSLTDPPNPRKAGENAFSDQAPLKGQALEDTKKQSQEYLDYTQHRLEKIRAAYLSKNLALKREQRRLKDLETQAGAPESRASQPATSPEPKKPADIEARLSDVERKLDQILKALKK
jgi:RNA polymerase sigma factor (sigma-70 family)